MSAPATSTTENVHVEIPHFHAMYEGDVAWDACGPVANEVAVACLEGRTPDIGNAQRTRERDLRAGHFTVGSGQELGDIYWDLTTQRGYTNVEQVPYSDTPDLNAIHELLKKGGCEGLPVILILTNAQALFDNQTGVHGHFVVSGGIDSQAGYLIANGDTKTGIGEHPGYPGTIPTNWIGWADIVSAQPHGALLVHPKPGMPNPVTPPPAPAPTPQPQPQPQPAPQPTQYTVTAAEADAFPLAAIAQAVYGDATLWPVIYEANKTLIGGNPNAVYAGEHLTIPPKPSNGAGPGYIVISGPARAETR